MFKKIVLVVALLAAGCHSLTTQEVTEIRDSAAAGKRLLDRWNADPSRRPDAVTRQFVYEFTRVNYSVLYTALGEQPPAEFAYITSGN